MKTFTDSDSNILQEIIQHRRDVRGNHFLNRPIPEESMERILKAGIHAPSVGYSQAWEFILIKEPRTKQQVREVFDEMNEEGSDTFQGERKQLYDQLKLEGIMEAPVNMAVFYKPVEEPVLGQTAMPEVGKYSVVCAVQNIWLMARSLNIGVGWVSILDPDRIKTILNVPETHELIAYLCLGYVDTFGEIPELEAKGWDTRKELEEVVHYEHYRHE